MTEQTKQLALLKLNFKNVEEKFLDFFNKEEPRWPGETRDYLRNHHKSLDNIPIHTITFEKLECRGLPEPILVELKTAFEAFDRGVTYQ